MRSNRAMLLPLVVALAAAAGRCFVSWSCGRQLEDSAARNREEPVASSSKDWQLPSSIGAFAAEDSTSFAARWTSLISAVMGVAGLAAVSRGQRLARARSGVERREALLAGALGGMAGAVVVESDPEAAVAYELERNRIAYYKDKAKTLNMAVDWYLFDVKPLVYPSVNIVTPEQCEAMGFACPDNQGLVKIRELYKANQTSNAGGGAVVSKLEREVLFPMKELALGNTVDPDTGEDLQEIFSKFEINQAGLAKAARENDLSKVRVKFDEGRLLMNTYFQKVNNAMGVPPDNEFYLTPMPVDNKVTEEEKYWVRRGEKYFVKKKVDAVSKGSKTARFYAKSIFGDDAEGLSWDPRGDRASDFYGKDGQ